jgi:trigger factor
MDKHEKNFSYTKEETKDKQIQLTVKVNPERFVAEKEHVYGHLAQEVKITGFRPGKAPKALIEAQISDQLYNETINHLLPEVTSEIIEELKMNPMNQVKYELVKMSDAEGIEYKATFINYPEVKLGDFKKIKIAKENKEVSAADVDAELAKIMKYYSKAAVKAPAAEGTSEEKPESKEEKEVELNDENVKSLGIGFETVAQLKEQVEKELTAVQARDAETKWLQSILDEAIKSSNVEVPESLVADSVKAREQEYLKKLTDLNLKLEEFLKVQNTTKEKLQKEWQDEAKKKFTEELLLLEIIKAEKFLVTDADIKAELEKVSDPKLQKELDTNEGKRYLVTVLLQQKAIEWLRDQVQK